DDMAHFVFARIAGREIIEGNWQEDRERALGRNSRIPSRAIVHVNADTMHFKFRFCSRGCRGYERQRKGTREQPQNGDGHGWPPAVAVGRGCPLFVESKAWRRYRRLALRVCGSGATIRAREFSLERALIAAGKAGSESTNR